MEGTGDPRLRPARSAAAVHLSGGRADLSPRTPGRPIRDHGR